MNPQGLRMGSCAISKPEMEMDERDGARKDTQRRSLPQPVEVKMRDRLAPRPKSFWIGSREKARGESKSTQMGWVGPLQAAGDLGVNSQRSSWRNSTRSVISNGSTASLRDSGSRLDRSRSNDRSSLRSNGSLSSVLTRFSGSTSSTLLTAPSSSRRSSMLQREKRFSIVKCGSHSDFPADTNPDP
jgi:hypothetical protein